MPEERRRRKQEVKIVPNASVEKCQKKAVRLVSAERHQKKNVCSAPAEMRQRKSRSERPRRTSADGSRAERERQAVAESRRTERERAVSAKESRLQRDYTPASAHRAAKESAVSGERRNARRRFMCARHPARSFTTRWNGRNTVIAQRDMSRNQSDPDAPARQSPARAGSAR